MTNYASLYPMPVLPTRGPTFGPSFGPRAIFSPPPVTPAPVQIPASDAPVPVFDPGAGGGESGGLAGPSAGSGLGPSPGVTGIDLGITGMDIANNLGAIGGRVGGIIGGGLVGGTIGALGGNLMGAASVNPALTGLGIAPVSGITASLPGILGGMSIADQTVANTIGAFGHELAQSAPAAPTPTSMSSLALDAVAPAINAAMSASAVPSAASPLASSVNPLALDMALDVMAMGGGRDIAAGAAHEMGHIDGAGGGAPGGGSPGHEGGHADGFAMGGFTGYGPLSEPAGTVHRGEVVIPASVVSMVGLDNLLPLTNPLTVGRGLTHLAGLRRGTSGQVRDAMLAGEGPRADWAPPYVAPFVLPGLDLALSGRSPLPLPPRGGPAFAEDTMGGPPAVVGGGGAGGPVFAEGAMEPPAVAPAPALVATATAPVRRRPVAPPSGALTTADLNDMSYALARGQDYAGAEGPARQTALARLAALYRGEAV